MHIFLSSWSVTLEMYNNLVNIYYEYMVKYEQVADYPKNLKPFKKSHREARVKSDIFFVKRCAPKSFLRKYRKRSEN